MRQGPARARVFLAPAATLVNSTGLSLPPPPPSTSGPGHGPFKAAARVRIPPGAPSFLSGTTGSSQLRFSPLLLTVACERQRGSRRGGRARARRGARARAERRLARRLPAPGVPVSLPRRDRGQREHGRYAGRGAGARSAIPGGGGAEARAQGPRAGVAHGMVDEPRGGRLLHGRRPL